MGPERGPELFEGLADQIMPEAAGRGLPRVRTPVRDQVAVHWLTLDELLPADHRARLVWLFVEKLDLSELYRAICGRGAARSPTCRSRRCWWRCGFMRPWSRSVGHGYLTGCAGSTSGFRWMCSGVDLDSPYARGLRGGAPRFWTGC